MHPTGLDVGSPPGRLRRLDTLPARWAWGLGIGVGALAGAVLAGLLPTWAGVGGAVVVLAAAGALAASGEPVAVAESPEAVPSRPVVPSLVEFVAIPGGSFRMGSLEDEEGRFPSEGPVHEVRISPFACMRVPVTRRIYQEVMGEDPGLPEGAADDRPVNNVSWVDAIRFCNRLSKREGLVPCYRIVVKNVTWESAADGYRLLTEAEWEYACRAGSTGRWCCGDDEKLLEEYAWFGRNSGGEPHPVGTRKPNRWGLQDMHGNVWEWCWDWYGAYEEGRPQTDPVGPEEGASRVLRGGSFDFPSRDLRSADRNGVEPVNRNWLIGFRCARSPRRQPLTPRPPLPYSPPSPRERGRPLPSLSDDG